MAVTPVTVGTFASIDPEMGRVCASFERTPPLLVPQPLQKAREVQAVWAKIPMQERCSRIGVLRDKIPKARDTLADAVA